MAAADARSNAFFKAFSDASREEQSALFAEIEKYKEQEFRNAEESAQHKYEEYIASATEDFAAEDGIEAEKRAAELKRNVLNLRTAITEKVFFAAEEKLLAFVQTAAYGELLKSSVGEMVKRCGGAPLTVFIKDRDLSFEAAIKAVFPAVTVKTDNAIRIGGVYGLCEEKRVTFNDLLETRLAAQRDWFYENSGLSFKSLR